jgi:hypothetical protein
MNGQSNPWTGEQLTVRKDYIGFTRERRYSRSRSYLTAAATVGLAAAFIFSRSLLGFGSTPREPGGGEPPPDT